MEAWADINMIMGGGWPPSELDKMSLNELSLWWEIAYRRNEERG
ncbi:GpE family phage tail protein [Histophilus somni]|nr:GpE family phage tail protein [Histophilus somni]